MALHGIHELHCDINGYKKNSLASIFKWLLALKQVLPRLSFENLSPSAILSYAITKNPKRVFCGAKFIEVPEGPNWKGSL